MGAIFDVVEMKSYSRYLHRSTPQNLNTTSKTTAFRLSHHLPPIDPTSPSQFLHVRSAFKTMRLEEPESLLFLVSTRVIWGSVVVFADLPCSCIYLELHYL